MDWGMAVPLVDPVDRRREGLSLLVGTCQLLLAGQPARMVGSAGLLYTAELFPQK